MTNKDIIEGLEEVSKWYRHKITEAEKIASIRVNLRQPYDQVTADQFLQKYKSHYNAIQAAISALREREWVEIDDPIIETWKDGRLVNLFPNRQGKIEYNCSWGIPNEWPNEMWRIENKLSINFTPTHAILPPRLPQLPGEE